MARPASSQTIELDYRVELSHWKAFNFAANAHANQHGMLRRLATGIIVGFAFLFLLFAGPILLSKLLASKVHELSFINGFMTAFFALGCVVVVATRRQVARFVRADGHVLGQRHVRLTHDAVEAWGRHDQARYSWNAFQDVTVAKDLVILWLEPGGALFIPRTAFAAPADEAAFVAIAQERIATSKTRSDQ